MNTVQRDLADAINATGRECCGHNALDGDVADAQTLLAELERRGYRLIKSDPFASAGPPTDARLAELLDTFQEAAQLYGYDWNEGSPQEERRSYQRMINARVEPVRLIIGERPVATNAPAIGGADAEPRPSRLDHVERLDNRLEYVESIVIGRDGPSVLDTLAERLTAIEDRLATWIPQEQA